MDDLDRTWSSSSSSSWSTTSDTWGQTENFCPEYWIGDSYCDDCLNDEANGFDGGDCCGDKVKKWFCDVCECKE